MRALLMLPIILAGFAGGWPAGSYSAVTDADSATLSPAIAAFLETRLPRSTAIVLDPAQTGDPIALTLGPQLDSAGLIRGPTGRHVRYVAAPLDDGVLLWISIDDRDGAARYFTHAANGRLYPAGPLMTAEAMP